MPGCAARPCQASEILPAQNRQSAPASPPPPIPLPPVLTLRSTGSWESSRPRLPSSLTARFHTWISNPQFAKGRASSEPGLTQVLACRRRLLEFECASAVVKPLPCRAFVSDRLKPVPCLHPQLVLLVPALLLSPNPNLPYPTLHRVTDPTLTLVPTVPYPCLLPL